MKSQSALEFMTIVGIGLIILAVTSALGVQSITSYSSDINTINARQTVNNLISATKLVYSQGIDSQTKVFVTVPDGVVQNRTYLYDGEINYRFEDIGVRDYFQRVGIKTYGLLPTSSGKTTITIRMLPGVTFESIMPGIETGAFFFLDEQDISIILVETYNDSVCDNVNSDITLCYDKNFSSTKNVSVLFTVFGFEGTTHTWVDELVELSVFRPDGSLFFREEYTESYVYVELNMENASGYPGAWLVSIMDPKTRAVGTTMFYMED